MYMICGTSTCSTIAATLMTVALLTDSEHRVRTEQLVKRKSGRGVVSGLIALGQGALQFLSWRRQVADLPNGLENGPVTRQEVQANGPVSTSYGATEHADKV